MPDQPNLLYHTVLNLITRNKMAENIATLRRVSNLPVPEALNPQQPRSAIPDMNEAEIVVLDRSMIRAAVAASFVPPALVLKNMMAPLPFPVMWLEWSTLDYGAAIGDLLGLDVRGRLEELGGNATTQKGYLIKQATVTSHEDVTVSPSGKRLKAMVHKLAPDRHDDVRITNVARDDSHRSVGRQIVTAQGFFSWSSLGNRSITVPGFSALAWSNGDDGGDTLFQTTPEPLPPDQLQRCAELILSPTYLDFIRQRGWDDDLHPVVGRVTYGSSVALDHDEFVKAMATDVSALQHSIRVMSQDARFLWAVMGLWSARNRSAVPFTNDARTATWRGRTLSGRDVSRTSSYRVLGVDLPRVTSHASGSSDPSGRTSPRDHAVEGHYCYSKKVPGKRWWRAAHRRGDKSLGTVTGHRVARSTVGRNSVPGQEAPSP